MDLAQLRLENSRYRKQCQERVTRSKLPKPLKDTLQVLLSHVGSASHYTCSWIAADSIAKMVGNRARTIERHLHILTQVGLILREILKVPVARRMLKERFDYELRVSSPNTWFVALTTVNRDHVFWQGGPTDALLAEIRRVSHVARVGGRKVSEMGAASGEHPVTSDTNIPSPVTLNIPSPVTSNLPSPVTEKLSYSEQEPLIPASPEPARAAASPEQSDAESVRRNSQRCEPVPGSGSGGFDLNDEKVSCGPQPAAVERVAGSHPLHGSEDPDDSVTPQIPEQHLSDSDDETVLEEAAFSATEASFLESEAVPTGSTTVPLIAATEEEDDGFLTGDGSLDFLFSQLDEA